tara:strand:- start:1156 stop:4518 length:3363 start_codon:yes stop_codon:yes gene_type:complete
MTIYDDYLNYTEEYKKIYGEKTIVLMQVGSFFECYALVDSNNNKKYFGSEINFFSQTCDMTISKKSACSCKGYDVVMAGFGTAQIEKYIKKLQDHGYTIVVFTQDVQAKNTSRSLYGIFSPGTYFGNENDERLSNNITCIWLHYVKNDFITKRENITIGIGNIDILTGKTSINEFSHDYFNNPTTFDQLEKYIAIYKPSEVILISNMSKESDIFEHVISYTNIQSSKIHKVFINQNYDSNEIEREKKKITTSTNFNDLNKELFSLASYAKNCEKQNYQEAIINKFYNNSEYNKDFYNYSIASQAFCFLLDFVNNHNPNLVKNISYPIFENYSEKLVLANHSLKQLNIISDERYSGKFSCLLNLLNNNITNIGKRKFNYELLNPITNIEKLNDYYDVTEFLLKDENYEFIRQQLNSIKDIEKFQRKLLLNKVSPKDFCVLYENLNETKNIYNSELFRYNKDLYNFLSNYLNKYVPFYNNLIGFIDNINEFIEQNFNIEKANNINIEKLSNYDIQELDFINKKVSIELNNKMRLSVDARDQIECIRLYLSELISKSEKSTKLTKASEFVKLHETSKMEASLIITKRRAALLECEINKLVSKDEKVIKLQYISKFTQCEENFDLNLETFYQKNHGSNNTIISIYNDQISEITNTMQNSKDSLLSFLSTIYNKIVNEFTDFIRFSENELKYMRENNEKNNENNIKQTDDINYTDFSNKSKLSIIIEFIATIDNAQNRSYIANKYNYCKPIIKENKKKKSIIDEIENSKSYVDFKKIRHPLIEHLNNKELYVTNDLNLGFEGEKNGILLYGTNAVGKTSFIKSIGISLIMAQSGLYVPCSEFTYYPYNYLFTRILGNDNIFKGLSTFAVEMSELRTILKNANENSIILGDELCSGTESTSALSIFVSGLEVINKIKSSYIFATHFHEILDYEEIKFLTQNQMEIYHMSVMFDREKKKLIYDRKLKPGSGETMYGLEVCKSLDLPNNFLDRAYEIRKKYNNTTKSDSILDKKSSSYNAKKIKNLDCEICKINKACEVHHLQFQKNADSKNIINGEFHKNNKANLINICEQCHDKIHETNIQYKFVKTNQGYELTESEDNDSEIVNNVFSEKLKLKKPRKKINNLEK